MNYKKVLITIIGFLLFATSSCHYQSKETRRMVKRLQQFKQQTLVKDNFFANALRFYYFDSIRHVNYNHLESWYDAGSEAIRAGFNDRAIGIFDTLLQKMASSEVNYPDEKTAAVKAKLGLSYLRKGEIDNCLHHHSAASCILPLRPAGFHVLTYGSDKASTVYHSLLKDYPNNLEYRWLYNIAQYTLGTPPSTIQPEWRIQIAHQNEEAVPKFEDIGMNVGAALNGLSGGCIIDDFNNDGILDIIASSWDLGDQIHYLEANVDNNELSYHDKTKEAGLEGITGGLNLVQADYNNDGWMDLLVLRGAWLQDNGRHPNSLLRNMGGGRFTDVTESANLLSYHPSQTAVWRDFNNDGWLDLFIGNEAISTTEGNSCELYISQQDGTFQNVARQAQVLVNRYVKGVAAADYDNDGWQDIYISTLYGQNYLLKNKGKPEVPEFENVTEAAGLDRELGSFPCWFWDYDNDGWQDIFVNEFIFEVEKESSLVKQVAAEYLGLPTQGGTGHLFRNLGNGTFEEVTNEAGLAKVAYTMGSNFGDFNNDGYLDPYLGTGEPSLSGVMPNRAFININGNYFREITAGAGLGHIQKGHAVAFGDFDQDGDQDIYQVLGGAFSGDTYFNALFRNPLINSGTHSEKVNWIKLKLTGSISNRSGIGARVTISFKENGTARKIFRELNSGGSFGSNPLRIEAGIGAATKIDSIEILWPGSSEPQLLVNLEANHFYHVIQDQEKTEKITLNPLSIKETNPKHHHGAASENKNPL